MDWEDRIITACEKLGVDPQHYNEDDLTKEVISQRLGFPSFESFNAFPESSAIIDGRGGALREEHYGFQMPLIEYCCKQIRHQYNISQNEEELEKQINQLLRYAEENFQLEYTFITASKVVENFGEDIDVEAIPRCKHILSSINS